MLCHSVVISVIKRNKRTSFLYKKAAVFEALILGLLLKIKIWRGYFLGFRKWNLAIHANDWGILNLLNIGSHYIYNIYNL